MKRKEASNDSYQQLHDHDEHIHTLKQERPHRDLAPSTLQCK